MCKKLQPNPCHKNKCVKIQRKNSFSIAVGKRVIVFPSVKLDLKLISDEIREIVIDNSKVKTFHTILISHI